MFVKQRGESCGIENPLSFNNHKLAEKVTGNQEDVIKKNIQTHHKLLWPDCCVRQHA